MRIISGKFKGRKINPPKKNYPTRPTTDFARESLFNILANRIDFEAISMLDLFGGFGLNALEAISRGAEKAVYIDNNKFCNSFVKSVREELGIKDNLDILFLDVYKFLRNTDKQFDFIFADPPYAQPKLASIPDLIFENQVLKPEGLLVLEHDQNNNFESHDHFKEQRKYGQSLFSFFM